jgi:hypothetical protein
MLEVEKYEDDDTENGFNFSIWNLSCPTKKLSFKEKIRWILHIIFKGELWSDSIIVTEENAKSISEFINTNIEKKV